MRHRGEKIKEISLKDKELMISKKFSFKEWKEREQTAIDLTSMQLRQSLLLYVIASYDWLELADTEAHFFN